VPVHSTDDGGEETFVGFGLGRVGSGMSAGHVWDTDREEELKSTCNFRDAGFASSGGSLVSSTERIHHVQQVKSETQSHPASPHDAIDADGKLALAFAEYTATIRDDNTHESLPEPLSPPRNAPRPSSLHFTSLAFASSARSLATCWSRSASEISVEMPAAARTRLFTTELRDMAVARLGEGRIPRARPMGRCVHAWKGTIELMC
jgi:hypothetical protein